MNDEELVELIERTIDDYFYASDMPIAERIAAALRSAGFQVFRLEDCQKFTGWIDVGAEEATYFLVPADSGGSG